MFHSHKLHFFLLKQNHVLWYFVSDNLFLWCTNSVYLCVLDSEADREREAAGPDPGLLGQCVRCGSSAGGCWEQRRGAGACGRITGAQRSGWHRRIWVNKRRQCCCTLREIVLKQCCLCGVAAECTASGDWEPDSRQNNWTGDSAHASHKGGWAAQSKCCLRVSQGTYVIFTQICLNKVKSM